jgi:hypothetical protein
MQMCWAAIGSAANVGVIYSEALARVSGGWPWQVEHGGPGGRQALVGILIKLAVSVAVVSALSTAAAVVPNAWTALAFGVGGPSIIKKVAQTYAENKTPSTGTPEPAAPPRVVDTPSPPTHPGPTWSPGTGPTRRFAPDPPTRPHQWHPPPGTPKAPGQLSPRPDPRWEQ